MEYHPDRTHHVNPNVKEVLQGLWDSTDGDFITRLGTVMFKAEQHIDICRKRLPNFNMEKRKAHSNPAILELLSWMQGPYWVAMEALLAEQEEDWSYARLISDDRFLRVVQFEEEALKMPPEETNTARVLRYCISSYHKYGKKLYVVSPGLAWEMANIQLRKMPSELLHLPHHAIYLTAPEGYRVYNQYTGWHPLEGMYIVADNAATPRTWRLLLTAGPNDNSVHTLDDALFHFFIKLDADKTVEGCIEATLDDVAKVMQPSRTVDGKTIHNSNLTEQQIEVFGLMRNELKRAFLYAVNVMLYCTHPDAEQEAFNANPEFQNLWNRAHKAKGKKRKDLFARVTAERGPEYIKLGGSVTVSRELRDAVEGGKKKGTKHSVRTYVSSHWQHFWTGPRDGERKRIYKLKRSHWKGAKDLPVSETSRHVR